MSGIRGQRLSDEGKAHLKQLREDAVVLAIFVTYLE